MHVSQYRCRHCDAPLENTVLDLGHQPLSNAYLTREQLSLPEITYPLRVFMCTECWLVQLPALIAADELFTDDYAYFSSTSTSWLTHARNYFDQVRQRFSLGPDSHVVEIGSNDGYLLRNAIEAGIPCLGVEPTSRTADAAESLGIPVIRDFFGYESARRLKTDGHRADLIVANNVYAHVPDINDFTQGLAELLKPEGVVTLEFPHLLQLVKNNQIDTIYHEHFSYLSLKVVQRIFAVSGLRVCDAEEIPTHGGSLRVFGCHLDAQHLTSDNVIDIINLEHRSGLEQLDTFHSLQSRANQVKNDLLTFLISQKGAGKSVAAYGAAAKGNTLLNFAGVKPDLLRFVCDAAESKQGKFLPGSHIPILPPETLQDQTPDWIVVLPWNIADEIYAKLHEISTSPVRCVTAIPKLNEL